MRVLIVDDSPVMRTCIERMLNMTGIEGLSCVKAGDGLEALRVLRRDSVDLILTDLNMPRMDGESFLRMMRARPEWQETPVMVISTDSTEARRERMSHLNVTAFLEKPFTAERFLEQFNQYMEGGEHA